MAFTPYTIEQNQFLSTVLNKLARSVFSNRAYTNPLKAFKKGFLENASDLEEIYVTRVTGANQNLAGSSTLDKVNPTVVTQYHRQNYAKLYTMTVSDKQVRKAFTTQEGVKKLADEQMQSILTGAEYDEYIAMRDNFQTLAGGVPSSGKFSVADPSTNQANVKALVKKVKAQVGKMKFRSTTFSTVENHSKPEDLMLVVTPEVMAEIDVEMFATAFNVPYAQMLDRIVEVDSLGTVEISSADKAVYCMVVDKDSLMVYDTLYNVEPQRNAQGMFTNHHLNVEKIISTSNMFPVAVFHAS